MSKNEESPATTEKGQMSAEKPAGTEREEISKYLDFVSGLKISKTSGRFLACNLLLNDLYTEFHNALFELYSDKEADKIISESYSNLTAEMENLFLYHFRESVREHIFDAYLTEI